MWLMINAMATKITIRIMAIMAIMHFFRRTLDYTMENKSHTCRQLKLKQKKVDAKKARRLPNTTHQITKNVVVSNYQVLQ